MSRPPVARALPDPAAARRAFDRAAPRFDAARAVHDEIRRRLLERLTYVRLEPRWLVDLGCGTGAGAHALAERYPHARVLALDCSAAMLSRRSAARPVRSLASVRADAERLPLRDHSVDLLLANLLLPWCRPDAVLAEAARVLRRGGLLLYSTLGPDTLKEVEGAWAAADDGVHVHAFLDMHDLGDLTVACGLAEPVMDVDRIEVTYRTAPSLARDLRAVGAVNTAVGRRLTLTAPGRWRRFEEALHARRREGRFPVTLELVLGQAWGIGGRPAATQDPTEVGVPIDRIGRRRSPRPW